MSKRAAEEPLGGDEKRSANPFAGVSLLSPATGGSLFATAAAGQSVPAGGGFALGSSSSTGSGFALAPTPGTASSTIGVESKGSNPFMGLSLFSAQPPSAGGLFSAAANAAAPAAGGLFGSATGAAVSSAGAVAPSAGGVPSPGVAKAADAAPAETKAAPVVEGDAPGPEEEEVAVEAGEEVPTGEEDEEAVFRADCKLWKLVRQEVASAATAEDKDKGWRWQERGSGTLVVFQHRKASSARLVMRMKGVLKLLLNTPIFPTAKYDPVGQKSIRFVGIDAELPPTENATFCAYRVNLQSGDQRDRFVAVLTDLHS